MLRKLFPVSLVAALLIALIFPFAALAQEDMQDPMSGPKKGQKMRNVVLEEDTLEDYYFFGRSLEANGKFEENLFFFGDQLLLNSEVEENAYVFAESVKISGKIEESLYVFADKVEIEGNIDADLNIFASEVLINGRIDDDLNVFASKLYVADSTRVRGNTRLTASNIQILREASFRGGIEINDKEVASLENYFAEEIPMSLGVGMVSNEGPAMRMAASQLGGASVVFVLLNIVGGALAVWALFRLFPIKTMQINDKLELTTPKILRNIRVGGTVFLISLVVGFVLAVSVVGWQLLALLVVLAVAAHMIAKLMVGYKLGEYLAEWTGVKLNVFFTALLGTLVLATLMAVISLIPWIGGLVTALLATFISFWALGGVLGTKYELLLKSFKKKK